MRGQTETAGPGGSGRAAFRAAAGRARSGQQGKSSSACCESLQFGHGSSPLSVPCCTRQLRSAPADAESAADGTRAVREKPSRMRPELKSQSQQQSPHAAARQRSMQRPAAAGHRAPRGKARPPAPHGSDSQARQPHTSAREFWRARVVRRSQPSRQQTSERPHCRCGAGRLPAVQRLAPSPMRPHAPTGSRALSRPLRTPQAALQAPSADESRLVRGGAACSGGGAERQAR
jgi:hypothetical protein